MRDIGIRIQRYRLQRYRAPGDAAGDRTRMIVALVLAAWGIWALFLSGHSAVRLMGLEHKKATTEKRLATVLQEVDRTGTELKQSDDPAVVERVLRERHNFAHEGEVLYVIEQDGSVNRGRDARGAGAGDSTAAGRGSP